MEASVAVEQRVDHLLGALVVAEQLDQQVKAPTVGPGPRAETGNGPIDVAPGGILLG